MKLFVGLIAVFISFSVWAGDIQAIVNDTPISNFDVESRAKILMFQRMGKVDEMTPMIKQVALDELVDERIKRQEALRRNIQVTEEEVKEALAHLEEQNGLKKGGFQKLLSEQGIPYQTLFDQTAANLSWLKVLQKSGRLEPATPAEIEARKSLIQEDMKKAKVSFMEIVVPTREEADLVWADLQRGADFKTIVREKSIASSRSTDGEVVDMDLDEYGESAKEAFNKMIVGDLSQPIKVPEGYAVIVMLAKRNAIDKDYIAVWEVAQAILPESSKTNGTMIKGIEGCEEFLQIAGSEAVKGTVQRGKTSLSQMPPEVAKILEQASVGRVAGPVQTRFGKLYLMKCQETKQQIIPPDEVLKAQIETEKMELKSNQLIQELKRDTVIDYK